MSATFRSGLDTAASFAHASNALCKCLFVNILPISRLNTRFYGSNQHSPSRKSNESNILRGAPQKFHTNNEVGNSFVGNILRVNYLESIFCGVSRTLVCKQLQQNEDFANMGYKKIFMLCSGPLRRSSVRSVVKQTSRISSQNKARHPPRFADLLTAMGQ